MPQPITIELEDEAPQQPVRAGTDDPKVVRFPGRGQQQTTDDRAYEPRPSRGGTAREACLALSKIGVNDWDVLNNGSQVKVEDVSFYPSTGSIVVDGCRKEKKKGFEAFVEVLRRERIIR